MKIDELIEQLEKMAFDFKWANGIGDEYVDLANKAAETIRLLWEIAQDNSNSKYKRQIDEWRGEDGNTA